MPKLLRGRYEGPTQAVWPPHTLASQLMKPRGRIPQHFRKSCQPLRADEVPSILRTTCNLTSPSLRLRRQVLLLSQSNKMRKLRGQRIRQMTELTDHSGLFHYHLVTPKELFFLSLLCEIFIPQRACLSDKY